MIDEEEKANKLFHRSQESVALETFHFMTHGSLIFLLVERKEFGRWDSLGKKKELEHKGSDYEIQILGQYSLKWRGVV